MVIESTTVMVLSLAIGFLLLLTGLLNLILAYSNRSTRWTTIFSALIACSGIWWFEPSQLVTVASLSAAYIAVCVTIQSEIGRMALRSLRTPVAAWTTAIIAGSSLMASGPFLYDKISEAQSSEFEDVMATIFEATSTTHEDFSIPAVTDKGQPVALLTPDHVRNRQETLNAERAALARVTQLGTSIQRMAAWDTSNCHGWVFTGGHFQIGGREVDKILNDNGYQPGEPKVGGIAIYRNTDNSVAHTAIVRFIHPDGTVMVEGKWGWMGVFLHEALVSPYGVNVTYYTSPRQGHVLKGLQEMSPYNNPRNLIR